jgi:putative IMPACT (imprinted ancient) family translation regulator
VYAFRVGFGASVTDGMSDDGEPPGTAGPPALAVLRGSGLGDTTVVVARFFGGTKLGTGGLVRAYGDAVRLVLDAVVPVQRVAVAAIRVSVPYGAYDALRRLLDDCGAHDVQPEFAVEVLVTATVPAAELPRLREAVAALTAGGGKVELRP